MTERRPVIDKPADTLELFFDLVFEDFLDAFLINISRIWVDRYTCLTS